MNTEELLKPRRKVIRGWFQSKINPFYVGDILVKNGIHFTRIGNPKSIHEDEVDKYPHLIEKMEWWEDRQPEDMPQYVKFKDKVYRVKEWIKTTEGIFMNLGYPNPSFTVGNHFYGHVSPSTQEEYEQYLVTNS